MMLISKHFYEMIVPSKCPSSQYPIKGELKTYYILCTFSHLLFSCLLSICSINMYLQVKILTIRPIK